MAINIRYAPPLRLIQQQALVSGLGDYQRRQQDQRLRWAQLAQNDRQFRQSIMARMAQQREAADRADARQIRGAQLQHMRDAYGRMADREGMAFRAAEAEKDRGLRRDLAETSRDWAVEDRDFRAAEADAAREYAWEAESADTADAVVKDVVSGYSEAVSSGAMTPEGKNIWNRKLGILRGLQAARGKMRPAQYAVQMEKWLKEVEEAGLDAHIQEPPSVEEQLKEKIGMWTDPRTGKQYPATFDRNGNPEFLHPEEKEEAPQPQQTNAAASMLNRWYDEDGSLTSAYDSDYKRAEQSIMDRREQENLAKAKAGADTSELKPPAPPTADEIREEMFKRAAEADKTRQELLEMSGQQANPVDNGVPLPPSTPEGRGDMMSPEGEPAPMPSDSGEPPPVPAMPADQAADEITAEIQAIDERIANLQANELPGPRGAQQKREVERLQRRRKNLEKETPADRMKAKAASAAAALRLKAKTLRDLGDDEAAKAFEEMAKIREKYPDGSLPAEVADRMEELHSAITRME